MPLFKRKSVKQNARPDEPQQPGGRAQQQRQSSPQKAAPGALNSNQSAGSGRGHGGVPMGAGPHERRPMERINDGTAALAASRSHRAGVMVAAGAQESNDSDALGDLGTGVGKLEGTDQPVNRSRLCKSLNELLHDNSALPYFIQFMGSCNRKQLVQFWLAAESFGNASWSKMRTDSMSAGESALSGNHLTTTIPEDRMESGGDQNNESNSPMNHPKVNIRISNEDSPGKDLATVKNNNETSLPEDREVKKESVSNNQVGGDSVTVVEPTISVTKENQVSASPKGSPQKAKTHMRAMSDSAVGVGKMFGGSGGFEPGHRRNNSWKEVDPRTAVERDAINIFTRYICRDASAPIGVPEDIRLEIIAKICPKDGQFDPDSFKKAQSYAFNVMDKQYFQSFLMSEFHCKYQIDVLTSGRVYLADILYNDTATFYFMEYLEQENAVHLLQFWLAGENFQQHLLSQHGQYDSMEAQSDAMVLYDKYFSLQATSPIGFDNNIRFEVESNICREGGPLPTCFNAPMRQAYTTLETMYFPGFLRNDLYYKFLSELINNIKSEQGGGAVAAALGTGSVSTALEDDQSSTSSDPSTTRGMRNTLLAEGNVVKLFEGEMNIDPLKFDPDSLWQRPNPGNMMFGKMNHLGQFVPEYEPDPESLQKRSSSTKFSLKKLVTNEDEKSKEEMALKIAQMIINDVNMQTQGLAGEDIPSPTTAAPSKIQSS